MRSINIPQKKDNNAQQIVEVDRSLVIVGANGSGKTRFSAQIERGYINEVHRIQAQRSLKFPKHTPTTTKALALNEFRYGVHVDHWEDNVYASNKEGHRFKGNLAIEPLDDVKQLFQLLFTLHFDDLTRNRDTSIKTKLDYVKEIWESVITHKKIDLGAGSVSIKGVSSSPSRAGIVYDASDMSDGERVVFYLIGQAVCAHANAIIIVDEPEMHLHKSITNRLWTAIENAREDCTFIYLTHDFDFATSRQRSRKIWLKEYCGDNSYDYEELCFLDGIPEKLYLEVLGSRRSVLFVEGDYKSIDFQIYSLIFPNFDIKPVGSGRKVYEYFKSFKEQKSFHHISAFGIIDRDRRTDNEVSKITQAGLYVTSVAECENLLLTEPVLNHLALQRGLDQTYVFESVKVLVIEEFKKHIERQALEHCKFRLEQDLERKIERVNDFEGLKSGFEEIVKLHDLDTLYKDFLSSFNSHLDLGDYQNILNIFNHKGLVKNEAIKKVCGLSKKENFVNEAITALKSDSDEVLCQLKNHFLILFD